MTPKIRLRPSASSASTPPSSRPLRRASTRKISIASLPLQSEICLAHESIGLELGGHAGELDAPDLEQIGAVDQLEQLLHVLLDDQHGEPFAPDSSHQIEHLLHDERRESRRRLVQQQELRFRHQ